MLNTMVSFVILLIARTARIACADRHTHTHTHTRQLLTLSAHARRGLIIIIDGDKLKFIEIIIIMERN